MLPLDSEGVFALEKILPSPRSGHALISFPAGLLAICAAAMVLASCESASIYYPEPVPPLPGWGSACATEVDATVVVVNDLPVPVEVHELLPADGCPPSFRGAVAPGETADLGIASGTVWRVYDAKSREWVASFVLEDGENVLVLE